VGWCPIDNEEEHSDIQTDKAIDSLETFCQNLYQISSHRTNKIYCQEFLFIGKRKQIVRFYK